MSEELKPCPFCGCEMEIVTVGRDWWRIKPVDGHEDTCPFGESHKWDCSQQKQEWKHEHISDWNNRVQVVYMYKRCVVCHFDCVNTPCYATKHGHVCEDCYESAKGVKSSYEEWLEE